MVPVVSMSPADPASALDLWIRPDEQCVALSRGFRLIQRRRGHRWSVDDMLVGELAGRSVTAPARALDLGCGLGSVLLMVARAHRRASLVGLEAQPEHVALARRNLWLNGCEGRARVVQGDLRDLELVDGLGTFDLITATPPYFDPRSATICADRLRAFAHFELLGGIEDYVRAASLALGPEGVLVACAAAEPAGRAEQALAAAGLAPTTIRPVAPRRDKPPFLLLLTATVAPAARPAPRAPLVLREADGGLTKEHQQLRCQLGLPR